MKCGAGGKVDKSHPHGLVSVAKVLVSINPPPHCGKSSRSTLSLQLRMHQLYEQKAWCHLYIHQSIKAFSAVCCVYRKHLSQSFVAFACTYQGVLLVQRWRTASTESRTPWLPGWRWAWSCLG